MVVAKSEASEPARRRGRPVGVVREKLLHPDGKDRVGLGSLVRLIEGRLGNHRLSSFVAQLLEDNTIVLRPRIEMDSGEFKSLTLSDSDRDAFVDALLGPPEPSKKLRVAFRRYKGRASQA